jgi:endonuclease YncB( thermonuclease family)
MTALLAATFWLAGVAGVASEEIRGYASVRSGSQIAIGKRVIHLFGVDAPRLKKICLVDGAKMKCGVVAWAELVRAADGWHLSCDIELKTPKGRSYATCYVGERDINETMVRSGWAKAARKQTNRYIVDEDDARTSRRGLWATGKR